MDTTSANDDGEAEKKQQHKETLDKISELQAENTTLQQTLEARAQTERALLAEN